MPRRQKELVNEKNHDVANPSRAQEEAPPRSPSPVPTCPPLPPQYATVTNWEDVIPRIFLTLLF